MNKGKYPVRMPMTYVSETVGAWIEYLVNNHNMKKSEAVRYILDNGLIYMATHGAGLGDEKP